MISSTSLDLPDHRREVREGCEKAGFNVRVMEQLPALDADSIEASLEMVDEADIYVGIFAFRYGHVPEGHKISITEMEYDRAVERSIPRLIFFAHEDHPVKARDVDTDANVARLNALKARLGGERVRSLFISAKDLRAQVVEALVNLALHEMARAHAESEQEKEALAKSLQEANEALERAKADPPAGETADTVETARERLAAGDTDDAERIFAEIAEREERAGAEHNRRAAEAYRHRAALAYLDNTEKAARLYAKAADLDPDDWDSLYRLALLQIRFGNLAAAKSAAERLLALRNRIDDPRVEYYGLSVLGDAEAALGNRSAALDQYEQARALIQALAAHDPNNAEWQRDLSVSYNKIGDIRAARGDRDGALKAYEDGLNIAKALATRDPNNAEWQTDLIVSASKLASLGGPHACRHAQEGLAIARRLAEEGKLAADQPYIPVMEALVAQHCG